MCAGRRREEVGEELFDLGSVRLYVQISLSQCQGQKLASSPWTISINSLPSRLVGVCPIISSTDGETNSTCSDQSAPKTDSSHVADLPRVLYTSRLSSRALLDHWLDTEQR